MQIWRARDKRVTVSRARVMAYVEFNEGVHTGAGVCSTRRESLPLPIVPGNPESRVAASFFVAAVPPHLRAEVATACAMRRRCEVLPRSPLGIELHARFAAHRCRLPKIDGYREDVVARRSTRAKNDGMIFSLTASRTGYSAL